MQDREEETGSPVPGESAEETHFQPQTAAPAVDKRRPHRRVRRDLERLSREVERWHGLHQAAAVVSGVRGEQEVYDTTTHSLSRLGFAAAVFAFDQRTQSLAVVSAAAASARLLRAVERLAGAPLVGFAFPLSKFDFYRKVIQRGESRFVELGSRHLAELLPETLSFLAGRLAARARLDYGIAVPLKAQGQTVAVLLVAGDDLTPDDVPVVTAFGDQTSTALENARLIEAERRQRQVAETLRRVTLLINASLDVDTVLDRILEQLSQVVEYDSTSLMLVESDQLVMRALRGFEEPEHVLAITYQVAENALFQEMLATRRPIVIPDVKADDRYVRWPGSTPVRSWIGVPLMVRGEIIGQLAVDKQQPNFYTQEDAELALAFAQQVAIAIENAQLFDSERRQREIAESLQEVAAVLNASLDLDTVLAGILEQLRRVVDYDSAGLLLQDGDDLLISDGVGLLEPGTVIGQRIPLSSDDPAVRVFKERCTLVIDDVQADPNWINVAGDHWIRGWIGAPLMAGAEPIGVLTVDSLRVGSYSREDADVVRSFAAHAAVAIENARLFEAEQRQRHMAEALHRAALALTSTMALDQVFDRILTELQHVVPYDSASVQLLKDDQLQIIGGRGFPNLSELLGISFPARGGNPNSLVLDARAPVIIGDVRPRYSDFAQEPHAAAGIHGWLGVPLLIGDRVIGMIALDKRQPDFYNETHAETAMAYAAQAATAIENARLHEALQEHAAELESRVDARTAEVNREHERLVAVLENAGEAIVIATANGIIEYANPAWEKLTGQKAQPGARIVDEETFTDVLIAVRSLAQPQRIWRKELTGQRPDGATYVVDLTVTPVFDNNRELVNLVAIYRDVTQYKELDRIKSEFLSTAAHELRSPLTSILGFSELLLFRNDLSQDERSRFLRYINDHAVHLKQLVGDLLDISRIETGADFTVHLQPLDLRSLFQEEIHAWQEAYPGHRYVLRGGRNWPPVYADRERIGQVIRNLLSNATKYSPRGGKIVVGAVPVGGFIEVTVSDEGIGMTGDELVHLFEKFWRADASPTAVEGTGLGLVIVKYIVEQHAGQIWVESSKNQGTTVHFTLPLVERQVTVLIVEDEDGVREVEHRILAGNGIATLLSHNGEQALQMAQAHRPDLILLDLMMPGMPGQEVLHTLKSNPATQHIPVLVVSARSGWQTIEESYSLGAVDFLTKPFEYQELLSRVRRALKIAGGSRQPAPSHQTLPIES